MEPAGQFGSDDFGDAAGLARVAVPVSARRRVAGGGPRPKAFKAHPPRIRMDRRAERRTCGGRAARASTCGATRKRSDGHQEAARRDLYSPSPSCSPG